MRAFIRVYPVLNKEVAQWLRNIGFDAFTYNWTKGIISFYRDEDAVAFKLRFPQFKEYEESNN